MRAPHTPYISIDYDKLINNIASMQEIADKANLKLRPHIKTHKSSTISELQINTGATGITVAKPEEALCFLQFDISSIKICYPIISKEKIRTLFEMSQHHNTEILFVLDSIEGLEVLEQAAIDLNKKAKAYIEIDVGLKRCGFLPSSSMLIETAHKINSSQHLNFQGLTSHAGQAYGATSFEQAKMIAEQERVLMLATRDKLISENIQVPEICIGSTPTLWAQENFEGITHIKPGNYVFNDLTQLNIGVIDWKQIALTVISSVVSINDTYIIIDAGSKSLTSDAGAHGSGNLSGYGLAFPVDKEPDQTTPFKIEKLSEEHGWIRHNGHKLPIGTQLKIYPNHACPVVNLFDKMHIFSQQEWIETWLVDARGCVG